MLKRLLPALVTAFIVNACGGSSSPTTPTPTASTCTVTVAQASMNVTATAGPSSIPVTAPSSCAWTVTSSQPWLTITSGTGATGSGNVTFTVAENTGAQRSATVTIGGTQVTVTQAAGFPPLVLVGTPPNPQVGVAYLFQFSVTGNSTPVTYSYETGVGFPPVGIQLNSNGSLTGTASTTTAGTFGVCATETGGRTKCERFTLSPSPATTSGAFVGSWRGTIVLQTGCTAPLPQNLPWTGTFRAAGTGYEIVVSVPLALVSNEVHPVTINGQRLSFSIDFEGPLNFVADFSADFRSLNGTFVSPQKCNINPPDTFWSGTWNGTKQ